MNQDIDKLLEKYYDGETSLEEEKELRIFFQQKDIPARLQSHAAQFKFFSETRNAQPSLTFSSNLAARLEPVQASPVRRFTSWIVRIAAGLALLIVGFSGGLIYNRSNSGSVLSISGQDAASVSEIKQMLAFEQTLNTSASERIQAVNQSSELVGKDKEITQLLINTLNFDPNVNVRLAACEALLHFEKEPNVAEALIQSLGIQTDPNMQIMLIEALVAIKEKRAVDQIEQLAKNQQVMDVVRLKAEEGLDRLSSENSPSA
jgi:hypothetical protein